MKAKSVNSHMNGWSEFIWSLKVKRKWKMIKIGLLNGK
jgi:hypothetical protein